MTRPSKVLRVSKRYKIASDWSIPLSHFKSFWDALDFRWPRNTKVRGLQTETGRPLDTYGLVQFNTFWKSLKWPAIFGQRPFALIFFWKCRRPKYPKWEVKNWTVFGAKIEIDRPVSSQGTSHFGFTDRPLYSWPPLVRLRNDDVIANTIYLEDLWWLPNHKILINSTTRWRYCVQIIILQVLPMIHFRPFKIHLLARSLIYMNLKVKKYSILIGRR